MSPPRTSPATSTRSLTVAGTLLLLVGVVVFMGIITAEALYPGYSTAENMISDLGGTEPPDSIIVQPSATIFDTTMIAAGLMIIAAAGGMTRALGWRAFGITLSLFGVGVLGVGIFPGHTGSVHGVFAMLAFIAGGVTAILAYTVATGPLRYVSVVLGAIPLANLALYTVVGDASPVAELGLGGLERWVAYPILLWVAGYGGYLLGQGARSFEVGGSG